MRKKWTQAQHAKYRATMAAKKGDNKKRSARVVQRQRPRETVLVLENGQLVKYKKTTATVEVLERIED